MILFYFIYYYINSVDILSSFTININKLKITIIHSYINITVNIISTLYKFDLRFAQLPIYNLFKCPL